MEIENMSVATKEEINFIDDKIIEYNLSKMQNVSQDLFESISFVIKDDDGKILAGIVGQKYYCNAAYIDVLWVDNEMRGTGLGSKLLTQFENVARELNCILIHLDTFDFQAPNFYEKHGYYLYGTLTDNPLGHKRFYYSKKLI
jgi:ribosomal protein S18 acetylase RimI-like enzyme